ncbi:MAG TPA: glycosyltransferase family 87 protein [Thermoanaerobaculia bacterium]|nr:glycosyltransferase family 87 protein [Thermoanaerobaculia bacterium]
MRSDRLLRAGVALWLLALTVVGILVCLDPVRRSVTPVFHLAAERWWARRPLYSDPRGFHYLPQFALLFAPFHALPLPLGDLLWRALSVAAVLAGCRSLARRAMEDDADRATRVLGLALVLSIWPCLGAVRNGQTNLAFGGLLVLAAGLLAAEDWTAAAAVLVLLVAVKPLGLVVVLLAPWGYPRMWARLAVGLALLAAIPFVFAPPGYVVAQYRDAAVHIASWSATNEQRFADLASLLRRIGVPPAPSAATAARAAFGVATLALWIVAARRRPEPKRALTLALLSAAYLLLFNPMTEKNTYAIAAPAMGVAAGWTFAAGTEGGKRWFGWLLAGTLLTIGVLPELVHRIDPGFGLWWDPLAMTAVAGAMVVRILRRRDSSPAAPLTAAE